MKPYSLVEQQHLQAVKDDLEKNLKLLTDEMRAADASLRTEMAEKATDSEEIAKTAAIQATESQERIKKIEAEVISALSDLNGYKSHALTELTSIKEERAHVASINVELTGKLKETRDLFSAVQASKDQIDVISQEITQKIDAINTYLEKSESLPESVLESENRLDECQKVSESIAGLLQHSLKRKQEIDELYKAIYGEDIKDNQGAVSHVDGLNDRLEASYRATSERVTNLSSQLDKLLTEIENEQRSAFAKDREAFEKLLSDSQTRVDAVDKQLTGLLPGAMAEGLSAAYEKKKEDEIASLQTFDRNFQIAIFVMIGISCIPFAIDIYMLMWKEKELSQIIRDTPSLVAVILPLYAPVLWLAYSSNRKSNLSKRLIEEYTHKAVLGKTFSGLSNQIETLPHQSAVKEELRTRLLFNVLQVSAENPGKLITNYNKADHPLMEALENSAKLADSVNALAKIPGFSAIAKKLSTKADELLKQQTERVENGLETQDSLEVENSEEKEIKA